MAISAISFSCICREDFKKSKSDESSSSEEEFDHMAEMLDHEMHYDEDNSDLDALD